MFPIFYVFLWPPANSAYCLSIFYLLSKRNVLDRKTPFQLHDSLSIQHTYLNLLIRMKELQSYPHSFNKGPAKFLLLTVNKEMKTVGVTDYTNQTPYKLFWTDKCLSSTPLKLRKY